MKRIIYSIWQDLNRSHSSAPSYKQDQLRKYKDRLIEVQKQYATLCDADYEHIICTSQDYDVIQFEKIELMYEFAKNYDEVLYLDIDIIPKTKVNMFEHFDTNNICAYSCPAPMPEKRAFQHKLQNADFHRMEPWNKAAAKKSMLLIDDIYGSDTIINTGVLLANRNALDKLAFKERIKYADEIFEECLDDNMYPEEISKTWWRNNEVYISYMLERYDIDFIDIMQPWNFILDNKNREYSAACHFVHQVNKDFKVGLG